MAQVKDDELRCASCGAAIPAGKPFYEIAKKAVGPRGGVLSFEAWGVVDESCFARLFGGKSVLPVLRRREAEAKKQRAAKNARSAAESARAPAEGSAAEPA